MKTGSIVCMILFVLGVGLSLLQLWFSPFETIMFWKLLLTLAAFFVVTLAVTLVIKEYLSEKDMKQKGFID